jgi:hypothetical protein
VNTGLTNTHVYALAICGGNIFAGTEAGGVFLSSNNGSSWISVNTGLTDTLVSSLAISGSKIFAGTYGGGVFLSSNNGSSWAAVNTGLTNLYIKALAISVDTIYAETIGGGVWKRALSEMTGIYELGIRNEELGIKIYPNPASDLITINKNSPSLSPGPNKYVLTLRNIQGQDISYKLSVISYQFINNCLQLKVDCSQLINGIYFLTLQNNQENYVSKVVIQK